MYLQITTKCNMSCDHCCFSCNMRGKHADYSTVVDGIAFARDTFGDETIAIGGGEPTLHPKFFDILKICLEDFDFVWMATNGSQTDIMYRLNDILNNEDYPDCDCMDHMTEDEYNYYGCLCHERGGYDQIWQDGKLSVALSLDPWHNPIDQRIEEIWRNRAKNRESHFEIRDVSASYRGAIAEGRGKRTGAGWSEGCGCPDLLIRPDGKIKICGCQKAPIIGDVWSGIEEKWEKIIYEDEQFKDDLCYKALRNRK